MFPRATNARYTASASFDWGARAYTIARVYNLGDERGRDHTHLQRQIKNKGPQSRLRRRIECQAGETRAKVIPLRKAIVKIDVLQ